MALAGTTRRGPDARGERMPLDLPPPLPPQLGDAAVLDDRYAVARAQETAIEVRVGGDVIRIGGNTRLESERIRRAASLADTAPQFILLLNALYAAEGYPLVTLVYARDPKSRVIYVLVSEGYLAEVDAPPLLAPYFEPFEGRRDLHQDDFEKMRVLAQIKADRAGYEVSAEYDSGEYDPDAYTLKLSAERDPEHDALRVGAVFGNPGNRFLGRYFGVLNANYHTPGGDVLGLSYATAFTGLGDARGGKRYDRYRLRYNAVTTRGLYSASLAYTEYELADRFGLGETEQAEIVRAELGGSQFLYADGKTRWVLSERLEYTDSITEFTEAPMSGELPDGTRFPVVGQRVQDEQYAAAGLATTLTRSWRLFGMPGSVSVEGGYKRGLGGAVRNLANPQRRKDFNLLDGEFSLRYRLPLSMVVSLELEGQKSIDRQVPQQEQWVLGGPGRLSAYLPGILVGDTGAYGRFQLQLPRWGSESRYLRLALYVEGGTAEFENTTGDAALTRAAADAGGMLELSPASWLTLTAHAAEGFGQRNLETVNGPDFVEERLADFYFSVNAQF